MYGKNVEPKRVFLSDDTMANISQIIIVLFHQSINIAVLAAIYRILADQFNCIAACTSSSKQEVVGSNHVRVTCGFFSQTLGKHILPPWYTVLHALVNVRVKANH